MKIIEIWNVKEKRNGNTFTYIIKEVWSFNSKRRPKFYQINKNDEVILHTSLWQTYEAYKRKIRRGEI